MVKADTVAVDDDDDVVDDDDINGVRRAFR